MLALGLEACDVKQMATRSLAACLKLAGFRSAHKCSPFAGCKYEYRTVPVFGVSHGHDAGKVGGDLDAGTTVVAAGAGAPHGAG